MDMQKEETRPTPAPEVQQPKKPTPQKNDSRDDSWRRGFFILLAVVICLACVTGGAFGGWLLSQHSRGTSSIITSADKDGNAIVTDEEASIASVASTVAPSVVSVITSNQVRSFFGTSSQEGAGTGIIVSKNGYVMTNNHVVDGASTVSIIDSEGTLYKDVKVIGSDPLNDVAFLKITTNNELTPAVIGDSSTVRIGQQVVAIGNALGKFQNTVTSGILSGTGRPITASNGQGSTESLTDLLQTDASINSGNSGGPLLNMSGQVIGINTAVATDANGIGFAIPINATRGLLEEVLETGTVKRAYIGINYVDITGAIARQYNLSVTSGAYVFAEQGNAVLKGSPAEKAGIQKGDIIQKIDDKTVGKHGGLSSITGLYRVGDTATVTILRDGKTITTKLTFGAYTAS